MSLANRIDKTSGFSLVELMVSMVLGLMLIAGAVTIYLASKQSYVEVEQVAALSENVRFAEQMLGGALRHAGFLGEAAASGVTVDDDLTANPPADDCDAPAAAYDLSRFGFAATADSSGNALDCITDAVPDTDVLVIKRALPLRYSDSDGDGDIDTPGALLAGKVYVMTNNVSGRLFNGSTPPSITTGGDVPNGSAWEYQYEVFYVRDGDIPQLARLALTYNSGTATMEFALPENIVEGVENMRLMFGFDGADVDTEVDSYVDVEEVTSTGNWDGVQSVEVSLLIRSATPDFQYTDTKTYRLGGGLTVGPFNDNFRRLTSFTSLSLRNLKLMIRGDA